LLIASAAAPPEEIYAAGDDTFKFQRTVSRLIEMQSEGYIANRERRLDKRHVGLDRCGPECQAG
jgi:predicted ATPase